MLQELYGRKEEITILEEALASPEAEMVSVIGRRRVGKTFLVKTVYREKIAFQMTGTQHAPRKEQLRNFAIQLKKVSPNDAVLKVPEDWLEAFYLLSEYLETKLSTEKIVVFLDEIPWMSTHKSGFLRGLSWFWNSWAVDKNIVIAICGSAASWMIKKVVNHRGGLHNRITRRIRLNPFTLSETEEYLSQRGIRFDRYQIVQIYMALGGIPHYLKEVKKGKSAAQNVNDICFSDSGILQDEFLRLYTSLFDKAERHISIIKLLAKKRKGLTRNEIAENADMAKGGTLSNVLEELSESGFISSFRPFGKKKKDVLYRLTDEYSLFYVHFIEGKEHEGENTWHHLSQTVAYKIWSGYTFESICLKHVPQIKKALSIAGISSLSSSFYKKGTSEEQGTQIDLLIDRKDHVINLFEIKFYNTTYTISKTYAEKLRDKTRIFKESTKTNKQIFWVFLSTFGLNENEHSQSIVMKNLTMDALFD
ncbi:MAG: AAA+ ATPase superfamily predicted ATPase [Saprospiraceae bacterium]|jgi:AAA+ ATPase superfamily predicted ATPase